MDIIQGTVIKGKQRGKDLGFPTANVPLTKTIPEGIYISRIMVKDTAYPALTFIGAAKTFHETDYQAETYILDFDKDIYNLSVSIHLLKKIRDNMQFASVEELVAQMEDDTKMARAYFEKQ